MVGPKMQDFLPKNQHAQRKFFLKNPTMTYGLSKIGHDFRKQIGSKIEFLTQKIDSKVRFRHFLTNRKSSYDLKKKNHLSMLILWPTTKWWWARLAPYPFLDACFRRPCRPIWFGSLATINQRHFIAWASLVFNRRLLAF